MLTLYTSLNGSKSFWYTQRERAKQDKNGFKMVCSTTILVTMNIRCLDCQYADVFKLDCHHSSAKIPAKS